jgi:hypothetical protein
MPGSLTAAAGGLAARVWNKKYWRGTMEENEKSVFEREDEIIESVGEEFEKNNIAFYGAYEPGIYLLYHVTPDQETAAALDSKNGKPGITVRIYETRMLYLSCVLARKKEPDRETAVLKELNRCNDMYMCLKFTLEGDGTVNARYERRISCEPGECGKEIYEDLCSFMDIIREEAENIRRAAGA